MDHKPFGPVAVAVGFSTVTFKAPAMRKNRRQPRLTPLQRFCPPKVTMQVELGVTVELTTWMMVVPPAASDA